MVILAKEIARIPEWMLNSSHCTTGCMMLYIGIVPGYLYTVYIPIEFPSEDNFMEIYACVKLEWLKAW